MTTAGAAVGLGNIFRFPYLAARYGLPFIIVYIFFLLVIGLPLLLSEIAFGRRFSGRKLGRRFGLLTLFCSANSFIILTYYTLLTAFVLLAVFFSFRLLSANTASAVFEPFLKGGTPFPLLSLVFTMAALFFCFGDTKRIEKISTVSVIFSVGVIFAVALFRGLVYYEKLGSLFTFDFTIFLLPHFWVDTLSQVFFSLSVAVGVLTAYGSCLKREENLVFCGVGVALVDLTVSLLATVIYATTDSEASGLFDSFSVYPDAFSSLGVLGFGLCFLFYLSLSFLCMDSLVSYLKSALLLIFPKRVKSEVSSAVVLCLVAFVFGLFLLFGSPADNIGFIDGKITPLIILFAALYETALFSRREILLQILDDINFRSDFKIIFRFFSLAIGLFAPLLILLLIIVQIFF